MYGRSTRLGTAHGADKEWDAIDKGEEVFDERDGGLVCPVKVLEDENEGLGAREPFKEAAGGEVNLIAQGLTVEVLEVLTKLAFYLDAEEAREIGEDLSTVGREEINDFFVRTSPRPLIRCHHPQCRRSARGSP